MIAIISVTEKGNLIAEKLSKSFPSVIYYKSKIRDFKLAEVTKEAMDNNKFIIFISSTGIAVRAISPYLKGKAVDPGVIVVDVGNKFTISLVSGHIGGANDLTFKVAEILHNTPVVTTATDNMGIVAPDILAIKNNLIIEDLKKAKYIAALLVNEKNVYYKDDNKQIPLPPGYINKEELTEDSIWITNKLLPKHFVDSSKILRLIRKNIVIGIGCRKDTCKEKLIKFVLSTLEENNIDYRSVCKIGSIDIKKNEQGIIELSKYLNCEFITFSREDIKKVEHEFIGSPFVYKTLGVGSVCEPAVDLLQGKIIVSKIKYDGMTLCIGEK